MKRRATTRRALGMTLLEVVLAMGLLVILSSMVYWFYASTLQTRGAVIARTQNLQLARVVLDRIADEIRQTPSQTGYRNVALRGEPERLWLVSVQAPKAHRSQKYMILDEKPPHEFDLVKVEYKILRHPEIDHDDGYPLPLGMARIEHRVPRKDTAETGEAFEDPDGVGMTNEDSYGFEEEGDEAQNEDDAQFDEAELGEEEDPIDKTEVQWDELYAPEVQFLRFCYYDGHTWWDTWDVTGDNPLPQLVHVTIGFEPQVPYGESMGTDEYDEFCTCMNEDPVDCEELEGDQFSIVVRLEQADILFTSRVTRESQALLEGLEGGAAP